MQDKQKSRMLKRDLEPQKIRYFDAPGWVTDDVWMFTAFSNVYILPTDAGLVMIDSGLSGMGRQIQKQLRDWTDDPINTVILTHGHVDHTGGLSDFRRADDLPQNIVAQENLPLRYDRYQLTHGWNGHINMIQFGLDKPTFPKNLVRPTQTFQHHLDLKIGDLSLEIRAAKGETDDMCTIWLPEQKYLFCGDLFEWIMPNAGNPRKVERYPLEWADSLAKLAELEPEYLFPGHGFVLQGKENIQILLHDIIALLRDLVSKVIERMNAGQTAEQIYHTVEPDPELINKWYLRPTYDDHRFVVRSVLRKYGGWWDGKGAELLPAPYQAQAQAIADLAGGIDAIITKGRALLAEGELALAAHHADWATEADSSNIAAQTFKRDVYEARLNKEKSLMAQGVFRHLTNEARQALGEKPLSSHTSLSM